MAVQLGSVAIIFPDVLVATAVVVTVNIPLVPPPEMMKAGTVAAVFVLDRLTVKPVGGAGPVRARVPVTLVPPVTELELNVYDIIAAGFTVTVLLALPVGSVAVTMTGVCVATPTVVTANDGEVVLPAGTVTVPLHAPDNIAGPGQGLKLRGMEIPPGGAAGLMVTVPVGFMPPSTVTGEVPPLSLTAVTMIVGGSTVTTFEAKGVEFVTVVAEIVACAELATVAAVRENVALLWPAGMVTD